MYTKLCRAAGYWAALGFFAVLFGESPGYSQTIYFQRHVTAPSNAISIDFMPVNGSSSDLMTLAPGLAQEARSGITFDGASTFYFTDADDNLIYSVQKGSPPALVIPGGIFEQADALSFDLTSGQLYILDIGGFSIYRAPTLNKDFPLTAPDVERFVGNISETIEITDMKYNNSDGMVYWASNGRLYRLSRDATTPTPEELSASFFGDIRYFDFDGGSPQQIYFIDASVSFKGIYRSNVPPAGNTSLSESQVFDATLEASLELVGISLDKNGNVLCYMGFSNDQSILRCGSRTNIDSAVEILRDPGDGSILATSPHQMFIESGPTPTPTPTATATLPAPVITATPTITPTPGIVRPNVVPSPPEVEVKPTEKGFNITINLQPFSGANPKKIKAKLAAFFGTLAAKAKKNKFGFKYDVQIKRVATADGTKLSKKAQTLKKITSKRNILTVSNLKPNSNYEVRYRVQITNKTKGQPAEVVKKTPFSPTTSFTIQ